MVIYDNQKYYMIIYDILFPYCGNDTKWWYVSCLDIMAMGKKNTFSNTMIL